MCVGPGIQSRPFFVVFPLRGAPGVRGSVPGLTTGGAAVRYRNRTCRSAYGWWHGEACHAHRSPASSLRSAAPLVRAGTLRPHDLLRPPARARGNARRPAVDGRFGLVEPLTNGGFTRAHTDIDIAIPQDEQRGRGDELMHAGIWWRLASCERISTVISTSSCIGARVPGPCCGAASACAFGDSPPTASRRERRAVLRRRVPLRAERAQDPDLDGGQSLDVRRPLVVHVALPGGVTIPVEDPTMSRRCGVRAVVRHGTRTTIASRPPRRSQDSRVIAMHGTALPDELVLAHQLVGCADRLRDRSARAARLCRAAATSRLGEMVSVPDDSAVREPAVLHVPEARNRIVRLGAQPRVQLSRVLFPAYLDGGRSGATGGRPSTPPRSITRCARCCSR